MQNSQQSAVTAILPQYPLQYTKCITSTLKQLGGRHDLSCRQGENTESFEEAIDEIHSALPKMQKLGAAYFFMWAEWQTFGKQYMQHRDNKIYTF